MSLPLQDAAGREEKGGVPQGLPFVLFALGLIKVGGRLDFVLSLLTFPSNQGLAYTFYFSSLAWKGSN